MIKRDDYSGVYAAAVTPLKSDYSVDLDAFPGYLSFLSQRGCHGALILGTTGEGPSFSPLQRVDIYRAALDVRQEHPSFRLFAGVGTPSMEETIFLAKRAFDMGYDGVVCLPPYYYRNAPDEGLYLWFNEVIQRSVPEGGAFFGYHFPAVSGVALSFNLLSKLKEAFPNKFAGLKNSSSDPDHVKALGKRFGNDLLVLTGNESLFSLSLENHAAGCISASANIVSPGLFKIWNSFQAGGREDSIQNTINKLNDALSAYQPASALYKTLLSNLHGFPNWPVCPPLVPLSRQLEEDAFQIVQQQLFDSVTGNHSPERLNIRQFIRN